MAKKFVPSIGMLYSAITGGATKGVGTPPVNPKIFADYEFRRKQNPTVLSTDFQKTAHNGQLYEFTESFSGKDKRLFTNEWNKGNSDYNIDLQNMLGRAAVIDANGKALYPDARLAVAGEARKLGIEDARIARETSLQGPMQRALPEGETPNFTVSRENLAPDIEGANLTSEIAAATEFHRKFQAIEGKPGEGGLSTGSTIGQLEGQEKGFNLSAEEKARRVPRPVGGTKIEKIKGSSGRTRTEITAEIENMPYKELHHIFGKAMGEKIISNVWRLIDAGQATVEDLINLNHWARSYGTGLGDFGTEAVDRVAHSGTHTHARKFGIEMSSTDIKAMPEFDNIDELTSYFRELLETRVKPMMGELDLQQGAYDILPDRLRLEVEQVKVAKEKASRDLTQSYKDIYKKTMPDTPQEVKDAYQTYRWIQEELGVTVEELIEKAEKLDQARLAQDQVDNQVQKLLGEERSRAIQAAQSKQIAREEQSEYLPGPTTRAGQSEQYAANRIDPREATERQMLEAGAPTSEAERLANIERIKSGEKATDILSKDAKGKYRKRKTPKKQSRK